MIRSYAPNNQVPPAQAAHGQMGSFGSMASPKLSTFIAPVAGKHCVYVSPMVSPLQVQCQSFPSEPGMSKPPEVVPKDLVFAAKQMQVLYIAQDPEAWNLQAAHAFSLVPKALSPSFSGSSTLGIGGSPNFPAFEGSFLRSAAAGATASARTSTQTARIATGDGRTCRAGSLES